MSGGRCAGLSLGGAERQLFELQSLALEALARAERQLFSGHLGLLLREFSRFFPRTFPGISPLTRSPSSRGAHLLDTPSHILPFILLAFPRHCPTSPPICSEALLIGSLRPSPLSFSHVSRIPITHFPIVLAVPPRPGGVWGSGRRGRCAGLSLGQSRTSVVCATGIETCGSALLCAIFLDNSPYARSPSVQSIEFLWQSFDVLWRIFPIFCEAEHPGGHFPVISKMQKMSAKLKQ